LHSLSLLELELAAAEVAKAKADIALINAVLQKCKIKAPFSGRVAERLVDPWQYVKAGEPLLDIIDDKNLEVVLLVPSSWLSWLKTGHKFKLFIDEKQREYPVKVAKIGARIDAVSQSIKIKSLIDGTFKGLLPGMSGRAIFSHQQIPVSNE